MSGALLVFAKEPVPGQVKTRMCPPLTPAQAAAFYEALLCDVLEASIAACTQLGLAPHLLMAPGDAAARMASRVPRAFAVLAQRGPDLAARMENGARDVHGRGHAPLLLRGSDSPALGAAALREALAALSRGADLALAPDQGGGYVLAALRRPAPGLFAHPMSTPRVLDDTLACARGLGLRAELLTPGFDVDSAADLSLLARARLQDPAPPCPRALAYLDEQALWPAPFA